VAHGGAADGATSEPKSHKLEAWFDLEKAGAPKLVTGSPRIDCLMISVLEKDKLGGRSVCREVDAMRDCHAGGLEIIFSSPAYPLAVERRSPGSHALERKSSRHIRAPPWGAGCCHSAEYMYHAVLSLLQHTAQIYSGAMDHRSTSVWLLFQLLLAYLRLRTPAPHVPRLGKGLCTLDSSLLSQCTDMHTPDMSGVCIYLICTLLKQSWQ
jgi:hypothetical protein